MSPTDNEVRALLTEAVYPLSGRCLLNICDGDVVALQIHSLYEIWPIRVFKKKIKIKPRSWQTFPDLCLEIDRKSTPAAVTEQIKQFLDTVDHKLALKQEKKALLEERINECLGEFQEIMPEIDRVGRTRKFQSTEEKGINVKGLFDLKGNVHEITVTGLSQESVKNILQIVAKTQETGDIKCEQP